MNRSVVLAATLATCLAVNAQPAATSAATSAAPAAAVPAGPPKIAVIAFQEAVTQTNDFQRKFGDLQKKFDPKRQELKALNDEIANLQKELQAQSATLSDAERARRAKAIDEKQKQLKRSGEDAQSDFQQQMQETYVGVASKVADVMNSYAQEHGYTVVLDGGNQQQPVVLYANASADITKAVVDAYNMKSGVPAPPAQPAAAAPGAAQAHPAAAVPGTATPKASQAHPEAH